MRRQGNVWVRTDRVEVRLERVALRRDARRIARLTGVDPDALIREAEALVGRARAAGAMTWDQINAFAAAELGVDPAALQADVDQVATWGRS